ncbi:ATP-dependent helicase HrpB [Adhaeribacter soli]|uniref:ATP-dependent helicase HrpB n=1 Tax=Adhaeribacter soli TaxID=2607655 RepID=A0A5N1JAP1_9BACT|nr:ATP-dependent helicase HrpB [Adhaeribacter soli]KAA9345929.1 ATP-dependent helicase HrpB [Adhaeribacter soli]
MPFEFLPDLPVKAVLPALGAALASSNRAILEAPPGAGKTTLVPLALLNASWREDNRILMLEPRRLAARAAAQRMAQLLDEPVGKTVGYRVRLEKVISEQTRIEVVTEGILTRMLQDDPTLEGIAAIIFDEFHERSMQADLGLALALDAQQVLRPDLRLLVMSATLDAKGIGAWLEAPVISSEGKMYPVDTVYLTPAEVAALDSRPAAKLATAVPKAIRQALKNYPEGDILVFLPGIGEIKKAAGLLENSLPETTDLHLLHGELPLPQQQAAIQPAPAGRRKVVLATSIAETSLTIEGVRIVIDGGFSRVPKFVPRTGLTALATIPVSAAAADQRRGRAGRLGPGICYRLWSAADQLHLLPQLPPEIREADLSGLLLELAIWGTRDITTLHWLDLPHPAAIAQAKDLLIRLEALSPNGQPTPHGRSIATLGLAPRLGHLVIKGQEVNEGPTACSLAALLGERDMLKPLESYRNEQPDLQLRLEILNGQRPHTPGFVIEENVLRRIREQAKSLRQRLKIQDAGLNPDAAGLLTALAYPDRLAQRETSGKVRLISGQKAQLATEQFGEAEFYAIAQLDAGQHPRIQLAAPISKAEILKHFAAQLEKTQEIKFDVNSNRIVARQLTSLGALVLEETSLSKPDPELVAEVMIKALLERGIERLPWSDAAKKLRQRLAFLHHYFPDAWPDLANENLEETADEWLLPHLVGLKSLDEIARLDFFEILLAFFPWEQRTELDRLAPTHLDVPSGSRIPLDYTDPASPVLAVRLQEVFGLLDTPRIGGGKVPLLIHLLSPASRPVQVTKDLRSFWNSGYFEVRKDLRGRYPKHHWPEDPLSAIPTRSIKRRS